MKAQLILVGGRPMPNVLTLIHQQPELIIAICSLQSFQKDWPGLRRIIEKLLPKCEVEEKVVDGYLLSQIKPVCESELKRSQDWIFNVTNATTIMSLGAYEIAKENIHEIPIRCWYLDTSGTRVISLTGKQLDSLQIAEIFSIKLEQYVTVYNYTLGEGNLRSHEIQYKREDWLGFAEFLGKNPDQANTLKLILNKIPGPPKADNTTRPYSTTHTSDTAYALLEKAQQIGLLSKLYRADEQTLGFHLSEQQYKFLNGAWLELYVWFEASKLGTFFDDCQWNKELLDSNKKELSNVTLSYKELDVSMIYKAQLIFAECKTGKEAHDTKTLDDIVTIGDMLGGKFVTKLLVTNLSSFDRLENDKEESFDKFLGKAHQRKIRVITREELPTIGNILRQEALEPTFARG